MKQGISSIGEYGQTSDNSWNIAMDYKNLITRDIVECKKFINITRYGFLESSEELLNSPFSVEESRIRGLIMLCNNLTDLISTGKSVINSDGRNKFLEDLKTFLFSVRDKIQKEYWAKEPSYFFTKKTERGNVIILTPKFEKLSEYVISKYEVVRTNLNKENLIFPNTKTLDKSGWKKALNERFINKG